jgi:hypothetical protein
VGSAYLTPPSGWETGWQSTPASGRHRFEGYYTIHEEGVTQLGPARTFPGGAEYSLWFGVIRGANPADPVSIASDYAPAGEVWPTTSVAEEDGRVLAFIVDESNAAGGPQSSYLPKLWNSDPIRWESNLSVFVDLRLVSTHRWSGVHCRVGACGKFNSALRNLCCENVHLRGAWTSECDLPQIWRIESFWKPELWRTVRASRRRRTSSVERVHVERSVL